VENQVENNKLINKLRKYSLYIHFWKQLIVRYLSLFTYRLGNKFKETKNNQETQRAKHMRGIIIVSLLILQSLVVSSSQTEPDFNFFYWVNYVMFPTTLTYIYVYIHTSYRIFIPRYMMQWPGAICDSQKGCCPPTKGNTASDFIIHGLWPQFNNGTWPAFCDQTNLFDISKVNIDLSLLVSN